MLDLARSIAPPPDPGGVTLTERAAGVARRVAEEEGLADHALRAAVAGGGCSGFRFDLYFDDERREGDVALVSRGVALVIDMMSAIYLEGATIDYVESALGEGFRFELPTRGSTCGGCAASHG